MMTRKSVYRDMDTCINCKACIIACKVKQMSPSYTVSRVEAEPRSLNLIQVYQYGPEMHGDKVHQAFVSIACMHCDDAPCIRVCPASSIYKDTETGITLVDKELCIGCKGCLWVCPYGAPSFSEDGKLALYDLCIDRLKEGKKTACEQTCQAGAIFIGTPAEISELQARKAAERIYRNAAY
ncbi:MAG: 4Fe-4S dicluster domain-containing protein [Candidatus Mariimomonas ferrooxydans]